MMFIACESSVLVYIIAYIMYNMYNVLIYLSHAMDSEETYIYIRMSSKKTRIWSFYIV